MTKDPGVAVVCSDIHLSHRPPIARTAESDWYGAMKRPLVQLEKLVEEYKVPLIIAGDIFHKWENPAELVNWTIRYLPKCYAIPGQHDLPFHRYDNLEKSSYGTLVQAGVITNLEPGKPIEIPGPYPIRLRGFPYSFEVKPLERDHTSMLVLEIAVIHSYIWKENKGYQGAPEEKRIGKWLKKLDGYSVAIFGDNHSGFKLESDVHCNILNCGGLVRRRKDEKHYQPKVGLIHASGKITRISLDVSKDKFAIVERPGSGGPANGMDLVIKELDELSEQSLDFEGLVKRRLEEKETRQGVKEKVLMALEDK